MEDAEQQKNQRDKLLIWKLWEFMNTKVITNAVQAEMPTNLKAEVGKPLVINLAPPGEYPQTIDDPEADGGRREVNQILDEQAIDTLISNFKNKVLVDADHSSETSTDTKAMAWVTRLFKDPEKGLMAEIEPTSIGAENINGKVYRFVSGAWTLDDDGRPIELVSIGLTNRPNLPVAPIINSAAVNTSDPGTVDPNGNSVTDDVQSAANAEPTDGVAEPVVDPADPQEPDPTAENSDQDPTNEGNNQMIEQLKQKLGLAPEATDEVNVRSVMHPFVYAVKSQYSESVSSVTPGQDNRPGDENDTIKKCHDNVIAKLNGAFTTLKELKKNLMA